MNARGPLVGLAGLAQRRFVAIPHDRIEPGIHEARAIDVSLDDGT